MLLKKINKEVVYTFPFCFLLLEYIFGMYFNRTFLEYPIGKLSSSFDEMLSMLLLGWTLVYSLTQKKRFSKEVKMFIGIAVFYLLYSFIIHANVPIAILSDFLVQTKPFIGYFMFVYIAFTLNKSQKLILKRISIFLFLLSLIVSFVAVLSQDFNRTLFFVYEHYTHFGTGLVLVALTYLYCADLSNRKELIVFVIILSLSLLSARSKIYGFYVVAIFLVLIVQGNIEIKISLKNIIIIVLLLGLVLVTIREKLFYYFIDYAGGEMEEMARPMLYLVGGQLFLDYFPFGTGFATFGTGYSIAYYSHIYGDYGLDEVWGISRDYSDFAMDSGFVAYAQFGIVGVVLLIIFFYQIFNKITKLNKVVNNRKRYIIAILLLIFMLIQSTTELFLSSSRGFYIMILLALIMNDLIYREKYIKLEEELE